MPKIPFWVFVVIAIIYFTAVRVDTMDVDASQYAEISREMMESGSYLQIFDRGIDYLDKPPLHFWLSALSMRIFGVGNFGYKLPAILFALWSLFATWRLGRLLYNDATGRMAALILATCQGAFLITNDVRCDTILMSCVVTSIWLIQEWVVSRRIVYLLAGSAAIALGMMTKGPVALMVPGFCFATDWVLRRQWRNFLTPAFIPAIIVMGILLLPMSIGLYQQFDLQPHKAVNGTTGVSGLRFFYWSQSFGRLTGESPWNNGAKLDFLLLNMLWSFLPWIFLFLTALVLSVATVIRQRFRLVAGQEWLTTGGFILAYLTLGSSAYQLPHYIFVVFPLAALLTAHFIHNMVAQGSYPALLRTMVPAHTVLSFLLLVAVGLLITLVFPAGIVVVVFWAVCFVGWLYLAITRKFKQYTLLWLPAIAMLVVNLFLTNWFYFPLLGYQVGSQVGTYLHNHNIAPASVMIYKPEDPLNALHFYAQGSIPGTDTSAALSRRYVLTMQKGINSLTEQGYKYTVIKQGEYFKVSELTLPFLNPATRSDEVRKYYLLAIDTPVPSGAVAQ
jgi:4-amino-4-deoxy-L-arabinose transferase-like glycosyltransferase